MKRKKMIGQETILGDTDKEFVVSYYVMEETAEGIYGVGIEKTETDSGSIEWDAVWNLSKSYRHAAAITKQLMKNKVTPISLAEAVDTIITMEEMNGEGKF
jgi:hypothetical protein